LALSELGYNVPDPWKPVFLNGIASSGIVSAIGALRAPTGRAPFRYTITKDYTQMNASEKMIAEHLAKFFSLKPGLVWPAPGGNPWNGAVNTVPIVGVMGRVGGSYYAILSNASDQNQTFMLPSTGTIAWSQYSGVSSNNRIIPVISGNTIAFMPNETVAI